MHPSLAGSRAAVFWLDREDAPTDAPALAGDRRADLVVGADFTRLWTALQAAEADPGRRIVVLEAATAAFGASGRNGGFCEASLTHGLGNGLAHWPVEHHDPTTQTLARHFFDTFPQLEGLRFTHRWSGPIASTTRFTCAWGTAHGGRTAWAAGYTGLGVGASRFGARVALDLVDGVTSERTDLSMVRRRPFPFPPEPARWLAVQATRAAIKRSDRRGGRPGPWLRTLDRFGIGLDS